MNTLQFIDSMTNHLAWPLVTAILGIIFRRSLAGLLERVRKLRWGDREAELAELAEATRGMQDAVEEAAKPLPENAEEGERANRERIERLLTDAAKWGFAISKTTDAPSLPQIRISWNGDQPELHVDDLAGLRASLLTFADVLSKSNLFSHGVDPKWGYRKSTVFKPMTDKDIFD